MQKGKLLLLIFILALTTLQLGGSNRTFERHLLSEDAPKASVREDLSDRPQVACNIDKIEAQIERYRTCDEAELRKLGRGDADTYVQTEYIACLNEILAAPATTPENREAARTYSAYYEAMSKRMEAQRTIDSLPSDGKILATSALSDLEDLESSRPDLVDVIHNERGIIYGILQDRKSAITAFGEARKANNSWGLPYTNLANIYSNGNVAEVAQAFSLYDKVTKSPNPPSTAFLGLANLHLKSGNTTAACNNIQIAYTQMPDSPEVLYTKARMLAGECGGSSSDTTDALYLLDKLLKGRNGTKGKGYLLRASLLENEPGDLAIQSLKEARKYPGDTATDRSAMVNLGRAFKRANQDTAGAAYVEQFLQIKNPDAAAFAAYIMLTNNRRWKGKVNQLQLAPDSLAYFVIEVVSELNSFNYSEKSIDLVKHVLSRRPNRIMPNYRALIDLFVLREEFINACSAVCDAIKELKGLPEDYIVALNTNTYYGGLRADCLAKIDIEADNCNWRP